MKAIVIDPVYKDQYNKEFFVEGYHYHISCLGTVSKWYRLKEKEDDIGCMSFGSNQIKIIK